MKRALVVLLIAGLFLGLSAVPSKALPLPPLTPPWPLMGESTLSSTTSPMPNPTYVDWIVWGPGTWGSPDPSLWLYEYQVENPAATATNLTQFSVNIDSAVVVMAGVNAYDLDKFHNLPGEFEPLPGILEPASPPALTLNTITWNLDPGAAFGWAGIEPGNESEALWLTSYWGPHYDYCVTQDAVPPAPWVGMVPTPVPEPTTLLLVGGGLLGLAGLRRKFHK